MGQGEFSLPLRENGSEWKILLADDELDVHTASRLVLNPLSYLGKGCALLSAFNSIEAIELLKTHPDTAIVILDMVMEKPDAGFEVARYIRNTMKELRIRILMRTGYPLDCPKGDILQRYGINRVTSKLDCTCETLTRQIITLLGEYDSDYRNMKYTSTLIKRLMSEKNINGRLNKIHGNLKQALNEAGIGMWRFELEKGIIHMNPHGIEKSFPIPHIRLVDMYSIMSSNDRDRLTESFMRHLEGQNDFFEGEFSLSSIKNINWNIRGRLDLSSPSPVLSGVYWNKNISCDQTGHGEGMKYHHILEGIRDVVIQADGKGIISYINSAIFELTGLEPSSLIGKHYSHLIGPDREDPINITAQSTDNMIEFPVYHKDGSIRWLEGYLSYTGNGSGGGLFHGTFRDVTRRKQTEDHWKHMAFHDTLTGLPNRLLLREKLELILARARRHGNRIGLLFIDLDDFKKINDSMGHDTGDAVLRGVAEILQDRIREIDIVARYGGDEFIVILDTVAESTGLECIIERIMDGFNEPVKTEKGPISITASMGIAVYPDDGTDVLALLGMADRALYHSKNSGKNNFTFSSRE